MGLMAVRGSYCSGAFCLRAFSTAGLCVVLALGVVPGLHAADLKFRPSITISEHYFDNSGEAFEAEGAPEFDYVTELAPSLAARTRGGRVSAGLLYRLQRLMYQGNSELDSTSQQFLADASAELLQDSLFLDLRSSRTQQTIDPANLVTSENITPNDNRTDVTTYQVTPRFYHNFGDVMNFVAAVDYADVNYTGEDADNSETLTYYTALRNSDPEQRARWDASLKQSKLSRENSDDQDYTSALLALSYDFSESLTAIGTMGYEETDLVSADGKDSGENWSVGANWRPGPRTTVTASAGRRFYGSTFLFSLKHNQGRNEWQAKYSEDVTSSAENALTNEIFDTTLTEDDTSGAGDSGDDSMIVTGTDPVVIDGTGLAAIDTGQYLSRRFSGSFTRKNPRTTMRVRLYREERELEIDGANDKVLGGDISWFWAIGNRTTSIIGGDWERQELAASASQEDEIWNARLELVRQLGRRSYGRLGLRHAESDSADAGTSYEQNQVTLSFNLHL